MMRRNIVVKKSMSFAYVFYRVFRPLIKLRYAVYKYFNRETPWLSIACIEFLKKHLRPEMKVYEFGSGMSTVFFAKRTNEVISVEHNSTWYSIVLAKLSERQLTHCKYRFKPKTEFASKTDEPLANEIHRFDEGFEVKLDYYDYYHSIDPYQPGYFDVILVDGRARVECVFNAHEKLKPGGLLILDNSERPQYKPVFEKLAGWKKMFTTSGLTDTTLFFKPTIRTENNCIEPK